VAKGYRGPLGRPAAHFRHLAGDGWNLCGKGEGAKRHVRLTGREHNSPKSAPHLPIASQLEKAASRHNVLNAPAVPIGLGCASSVGFRLIVSR
jgi:hypothetical protein